MIVTRERKVVTEKEMFSLILQVQNFLCWRSWLVEQGYIGQNSISACFQPQNCWNVWKARNTRTWEDVNGSTLCLSERVNGSKLCLSECVNDSTLCLSKHVNGSRSETWEDVNGSTLKTWEYVNCYYLTASLSRIQSASVCPLFTIIITFR